MSEPLSGPPIHLRKQDWSYEILRRWITTGELKAGGRIDQDHLAERLNLSRVPIRQALVRLQAEGLVDQRPHRGWYVAELDIQDARDVYAGRRALESMLTGRAASLIADEEINSLEEVLAAQEQALKNDDLELARVHDRSFHDQIFQATGLERSCAAQRSLRGIADRYVAMYMSSRKRAKESVSQHRAILDAIKSHDEITAAQLAAEHVADGIALLENLLDPAQNPDAQSSPPVLSQAQNDETATTVH